MVVVVVGVGLAGPDFLAAQFEPLLHVGDQLGDDVDVGLGLLLDQPVHLHLLLSASASLGSLSQRFAHC